MKWKPKPDDVIMFWNRPFRPRQPHPRYYFMRHMSIPEKLGVVQIGTPRNVTRLGFKRVTSDCRHRICRGHTRTGAYGRLTHFIFSSRKLRR